MKRFLSIVKAVVIGTAITLQRFFGGSKAVEDTKEVQLEPVPELDPYELLMEQYINGTPEEMARADYILTSEDPEVIEVRNKIYFHSIVKGQPKRVGEYKPMSERAGWGGDNVLDTPPGPEEQHDGSE